MKYVTILADPPWPHESFVTGHVTAKRKVHRTKALPYPSMDVAEICAMQIARVAAADAWLFLRTPNSYLPAAFDVAEAWGFLYRQMLVWVKTGTPNPFPGCIAPNHAEYLLVCRRGSPRRRNTIPSSVVHAPRAADGEHSRKPEVFIDLIQRVTSRAQGPRLEIFARQHRSGWETWGNQVITMDEDILAVLGAA